MLSEEKENTMKYILRHFSITSIGSPVSSSAGGTSRYKTRTKTGIFPRSEEGDTNLGQVRSLVASLSHGDVVIAAALMVHQEL